VSYMTDKPTGYTASADWNRSFLRQSHAEFAFWIVVVLAVLFTGPRSETWRYVLAGTTLMGVIVGYLTVGIKAFKGYARRGRRGARTDLLLPGTNLRDHQRNTIIHLGITVIAAGIIAWTFPGNIMVYVVFAMMTMVDGWHLLAKISDLLKLLLVTFAAVLLGLLSTTGQRLGQNEWIIVIVAVAACAISSSFVVWIETRNARETERYVRLADELKAAQSVIASQQHAAGVFAERERMAGEIHDTLAQGFLAIVTQTQVAKAAIGRNDEAIRERLAVIEQVARENLAEARGLVAATAPVPLHDAGLSEALHNLGSRFSNETGIAVTVNTPDADLLDLSAPDEVVLIRAAQEALNNIRKHSGATSATVSLAIQDGAPLLEIADNGRGMADGAQQGFGLSGMRDRVESVGGTMAIESAEPGTIIRIELRRTE
jgi:signal transduction histidine kinase